MAESNEPDTASNREQSRRRLSEEALRVKTEQLTAVTDAMSAFLETGDWRAASAGLLASAVHQTNSEYGFIGVVVDGPVLRVLAHEGMTWSADTDRTIYENAMRMYEERGHVEFTNLNTLFGRVITEKRPILANDPANDPRSAGTPPGHPPLRHFLGVPIFNRSDVVGMIGIANRPGGYAENEQEKIEILCRSAGVLYESYRQRKRESRLERQGQDAERALRQSELRLQHALNAIEGGVWDWNVTTGHVYFSPRWAEMLGYEPGELEPDVRTWAGMLHPEDEPEVMRRVKDHFEGKSQAYRSEHRLRTKSGEWIWVLDRGQVVARDDRGRPLRMTGTDVDITGRKAAEAERSQLQAQIQHAQKLESLGVLAGGVAHDFNNLLTAILGHASLAHDLLSPDSPGREQLRQIETAALRAAELTNQMLAYSGRGKFVVEPVNLSKLVVETGQLLQAAVSKSAELEFELEHDLPLVAGDSAQLRQIVMNLITNASEALGQGGGVVTIRTRAVRADGEYLARTYIDDRLPDGDYVCLEVADTGCGMDAETRRSLFDPFFTTKFAGRGLGLAVVLGIVRGHKGAIDIDSRPGAGTRFRILLPARKDLREATNEAPRAACVRTSGTVLVVDDEKGVRAVSRSILEHAGFSVLSAENGVAALEVFDEHRDEICAVLLDLTMPRMDGEKTFRAIHDRSPQTPVILSSGYNEQELEERFSNHGFAGFIQKPYSSRTLIRRLGDALAPPGAGSPAP